VTVVESQLSVLLVDWWVQNDLVFHWPVIDWPKELKSLRFTFDPEHDGNNKLAGLEPSTKFCSAFFDIGWKAKQEAIMSDFKTQLMMQIGAEI